jgi:glycosyltransferase involved in cell wall biosynthesis
MKLLYINLGQPTEGVRKKLLDKIYFLQRENIDIRFCQVGGVRDTHNDSIHIPVSLDFARKFDKVPLLWRFSVVLEQYVAYRALGKFLSGATFDWIVFRYPVADFFLWKFVNQFPNTVIFEHNTIELKELAIRRPNSWYYQYFYFSEKFLGRKVRSKAKAFVGVTHEITHSQLAIAKKHTPAITISNGIDVLRTPKRKGPAYTGEILNLLLLAGSAAPWHGVDIIIESLQRFRSEDRVHCFIAGNVSEDQRKKIAAVKNITHLPHQHGAELDSLIDQCHVGIGSLGFSDSFLHEACPLKVREYWSRGLPFVIGYKDTDIDGNQEMEPFYLRCTLPLSIDDLVLFAKKVYLIKDLSERMRAIALRQIHYSVKAKTYGEFINSLGE